MTEKTNYYYNIKNVKYMCNTWFSVIMILYILEFCFGVIFIFCSYNTNNFAESVASPVASLPLVGLFFYPLDFLTKITMLF